MSDIITEQSDGVLRIQFNRPEKKNAMTASMYVGLADILNAAGRDDDVRVALLHGAGDSFCAGNDVQDFLKNPPRPGQSPQEHLMEALINFDKPLIAAVHGAAIGGGTTMLTHFDFAYAASNTTFQTPFINLALVPEFGSSFSLPARLGHIHAAELLMLGQPFSATRAAELGIVTRVVPDQELMIAATDIARKLASKPGGALQACKRLMKQATRPQIEQAIKTENAEFGSRLQGPETKEALSAFLEKRAPDFTKAREPAMAK